MSRAVTSHSFDRYDLHLPRLAQVQEDEWPTTRSYLEMVIEQLDPVYCFGAAEDRLDTGWWPWMEATVSASVEVGRLPPVLPWFSAVPNTPAWLGLLESRRFNPRPLETIGRHLLLQLTNSPYTGSGDYARSSRSPVALDDALHSLVGATLVRVRRLGWRYEGEFYLDGMPLELTFADRRVLVLNGSDGFGAPKPDFNPPDDVPDSDIVDLSDEVRAALGQRVLSAGFSIDASDESTEIRFSSPVGDLVLIDCYESLSVEYQPMTEAC